MSDTSELMVRFIDAAEFLIARHIREWGFEVREISSETVSPGSLQLG
jgi:hypothetical protein